MSENPITVFLSKVQRVLRVLVIIKDAITELFQYCYYISLNRVEVSKGMLRQ